MKKKLAKKSKKIQVKKTPRFLPLLLSLTPLFIAGILFLFLSSCGYRWTPDCSSSPTISVPFIEGDEDGSFTTELIRTIASSGVAKIQRKGADYRLKVAIVRGTTETIGYRKDEQKVDGKISRNMVADEGRKSLSIEAALYRANTDEIAFGPYFIEGDVDYDYVDGDSYPDLTFVDPTGVTQAVLPFSLGQLESPESAQEAAIRPLYVQLSKKIVDVISGEW